MKLEKLEETRPLEAARKYNIPVRILSTVPTILLIVVLGSITLSLYSYFKTVVIPEVRADLLTFFLKIIVRLYQAPPLDLASIIGFVCVMILYGSLSIRLSIFSIVTLASLLVFGYIFILPLISTLGGFFLLPLQLPRASGVMDILLLTLYQLYGVGLYAFKFLKLWVLNQGLQPIMFLIISSCLAVLAMMVDKKSSQVDGLRIPEKNIVRYALTGGGLGVILGALIFRHKTKHVGLLIHVGIVTFATLYILGAGMVG